MLQRVIRRSRRRRPGLILALWVLAGWVLALCVLTFAGCTASSPRTPPVAETGVIDLGSVDLEQDGPVSLDGRWQWYWHALLEPGDRRAAPTGLFSVPGVWNDLKVDGETLDSRGYATFRLHVKLPHPGSFGLLLRYSACAYRLWVDGTEVASSGVIGTTAEATRPASISRIATFTVSRPAVDLTLQLASFGHARGGPRARLILGSVDQVRAIRERQVVLYALLTGALALLVLYQLVGFALRPAEPAPLYLAGLCAMIGIWQLMQGPLLFTLLFPQVSWPVSIRLEYLAICLGPVMAALFIRTLYPTHYPRWLFQAQLLFVAMALGVLAAPTLTVTAMLPLCTVAICASAPAHTYVLLRAARERRIEVFISLAGLLPLFATVLIDSFAVFTAPATPNTATPLGMLCLIVAEAFVVARRSVQTLETVEQQAEQLARLNTAYYRFVPQAFLRLLGKDDIMAVHLGDQTQREMAVLFADVRGFTSISEKMSLEENFEFVNRLLGLFGPVIRKHGGFIDKYLGDGIMALFPGSPGDALEAAIEMRRVLGRFNTRRTAAGGPSIEIGIGVHVGMLMLGTVGEPERMDGTVIADAVNTAARLEGLTRRYGVTTLVSDRVLENLPAPDRFSVRALGRVRPKGKQQPVSIYEVFEGDGEQSAQLKRATRAEFEAGLAMYQDGRFAEAAECFERVLQHHPGDSAAAYYAQQASRCRTFPPPGDWDGIEVLTEK